jgi:hypothetical protein
VRLDLRLGGAIAGTWLLGLHSIVITSSEWPSGACFQGFVPAPVSATAFSDTLAAMFAKRLTEAILDDEIICADETGRPIFMEMLRGRRPMRFVRYPPPSSMPRAIDVIRTERTMAVRTRTAPSVLAANRRNVASSADQNYSCCICYWFSASRQKGQRQVAAPTGLDRQLDSGREVGVDIVEDGFDRGARQRDGADTDHGDQAEEDAVLDHRGAGLVFNQARKKLLHNSYPP